MVEEGLKGLLWCLGWNSWNHFGCDGYNYTTIKQTADAFITQGLFKAGYRYVVSPPVRGASGSDLGRTWTIAGLRMIETPLEDFNQMRRSSLRAKDSLCRTLSTTSTAEVSSLVSTLMRGVAPVPIKTLEV